MRYCTSSFALLVLTFITFLSEPVAAGSEVYLKETVILGAQTSPINQTPKLSLPTSPRKLQEAYQKNLRLLTDELINSSLTLAQPSIAVKESDQFIPIRRHGFLDISSSKLEDYLIKENSPLTTRWIENKISDFKLLITNSLHTANLMNPEFDRRDPQTTLYFQINCNEKVDIRKGRYITRGKKNWSWRLVGYRSSIHFPHSEIDCHLTFDKEKTSHPRYGIRIRSEAPRTFQKLATEIQNVCLYDPTKENEDILSYMENSPSSSMSCLEPISEIEYFKEPKDSFQRKIEVLTGHKIPLAEIGVLPPKELISCMNPPPLDLILISYFSFKADYYGHSLEQALSCQAQRGAEIRILIPDFPVQSFLTSQDRTFLKRLQKLSPHVHVQKYMYKRRGRNLRQTINAYHRTLHTKMFLTLSKNPNYNLAIVGGRNTKDHYLFKERMKYSSYPTFNQYKISEYVFYKDLEMLIKSPSLVKQMAAQFATFWYRDNQSLNVRAKQIHLPIPRLKDLIKTELTGFKNQQQAWGRHFFSIPYLDNREVQNIFVDLIKSAQKEILITSPYFRLVRRVKSALLDAVKRGVQVKIITNISLVKDNVPFFTDDVNIKTINEFYKTFQIYVWNQPSILHIKSMMIDQQMLYLGGVNFNQRSFYHDVENGILLSGETAIKPFNDIFQDFVTKSEEIKEFHPLPKVHRFLIRLFGQYF